MAELRRNRWRELVKSAVVVAVCLGGVTSCILWISLSGPFEDTAAGFLADLQANRYQSAYDRLCDAQKERVSQVDFAEATSTTDQISGFEFTESAYSEGGHEGHGWVTVELTYASGRVDTYTMWLTKRRDGQWQVCPDDPTWRVLPS